MQDFDKWRDSVAMAFHPEPENDWINTKKGWVRVVVGASGYQLNSGELINLE